MKKLLSVILLLSFLSAYSQSEDLPLSMVPDTPPSPQAQALDRLGEYRTNPTGMPEISIPLHTIDYHGYSIPISLNYEASPIKAGYNYDVYGRGWSLGGMSCVSRVLRGMPDEDRNFKIDHAQLHESIDTWDDMTDKFEYIRHFNFQLDQFSVVLPNGRYFNFFIRRDEQNNIVYELPYECSHVKMECSADLAMSYFRLTDEEGVIYTFDATDYIHYEYKDYIPVTTTWLLTSIEIPNKGTIEYEYNDKVKILYSGNGETMLSFWGLHTGGIDMNVQYLGYDISYDYIYNGGEHYMRQIKRIKYDNTSVIFNYKSDNVHINNISIVDNGNTVRQIVFTLGTTYVALEKLSFIGEGGIDKLDYKFLYSSVDIGNHTDHWGYSGVSDYITDIGNFNINVNGFANTLSFAVASQSGYLQIYPEANSYIAGCRKIKLQSSMTNESRQPLGPERHGILSCIIYPNGGKTSFTFENHKYLTASLANGEFEMNRRQQRIAEGGGFRIKRIVNYDCNGDVIDEQTYKYGLTYEEIERDNLPFPSRQGATLTSHTNCGEPVVDPNVLTYLNYDCTSHIPRGLINTMVGIGNDGESGTFDNLSFADRHPDNHWAWHWRFSAHNFRNLLGARPAVVYPLITVYHGTVSDDYSYANVTGKTEYRYDIYDYESVDNYLRQLKRFDYPDTTYFEQVKKLENVLFAEMHGHKRTRLMEKAEFAADKSGNDTKYDIIERERYCYNDNEKTVNSRIIYNNRYNRGKPGVFSFHSSVGKRLFSFDELYSSIVDYIGTSLLVSKTTTKYRKDGNRFVSHSQMENYEYKYGDHLFRKEYWDNGNKVYSRQYLEPSDTASVLVKMKEKNMFAYPLLSTTANKYVHEVAIESQKIAYKEYEYSGDLKKYMPSLIYELHKGHYEPSYEVLAYSIHGNPIEVVDLKTNVHTVYVWGYNDRYLIAEVRNSTKSEVDNAINAIQGNINSSSLQITTLERLRNLLPSASIKTWTHKPLFGVTAHSDESGNMMFYSYDGLGRLKEEYYYESNNISESNKRTVKSYEYEFKNQ